MYKIFTENINNRMLGGHFIWNFSYRLYIRTESLTTYSYIIYKEAKTM